MRVLITGANGFIGRSLLRFLADAGHTVKAAVRRPIKLSHVGKCSLVGDIGPETDWADALTDVDVIVHLAARVHVMHGNGPDALSVFRRVNVEGTRNLAYAAAQAGVRRFIFVSSVKVNGEMTRERPFDEEMKPAPEDAYGVSKWEAEQALHAVSRQTGLDVVILRIPLVYGPGVGANFLRLMQLVSQGLPLPLASIQNLRSLLYVENLSDAINTCLEHPNAPGRTFLVSDGEDVSTPTLIRLLTRLMKAHDRLWAIPVVLLRLLGTVTRKSAEIARLTDSLRVDSSAIRKQLDWLPPYTLGQGLADTVSWFLDKTREAHLSTTSTIRPCKTQD